MQWEVALLFQRTLQMFCSLPHCTDFTKAFFTLKASYGCKVEMFPRAGLCASENRWSSCLCRESNSDSPDWAVYSPVSKPTAMCRLPTAQSMKPWLATFILFWSYSLWIYMYVCLFVSGEQSDWMGVTGGPFLLTKTLRQLRCGAEADISQVSFSSHYHRETKACGSIDCTLDSDSKLRQRDVRNSS